MADNFGYSAMPGAAVAALTTERNAILGPITWYLLKGVVINGSASSDASNTPTTELRHGLLMGLPTSDGFAANYGPNATDGSQLVAGFFGKPVGRLTTTEIPASTAPPSWSSPVMFRRPSCCCSTSRPARRCRAGSSSTTA